MGRLISRRHFLPMLLVAVIGSVMLSGGVDAADDLFGGRTVLVMVDDAGCVYCAKWDREVKTAYEASPEGRFARLERWRIGSPQVAGLSQLAYTPTFILVVGGREAGRIVGYAGADFFWAEIERLYAMAGFPSGAAPAVPVEDRADLSGVPYQSVRVN